MWRTHSSLVVLILACGASVDGLRASTELTPSLQPASSGPPSFFAEQAAASSATSPAAAQSSDALAEEYAALEKQYREALTTYYEPYEKAKSDEERDKIVLDASRDPNKLFPPKFKELAARAKGTETRLMCFLWIVKNDQVKSDSNEAIDVLMIEYIQSPKLADLAAALRQRAWTLGLDRARSTLEQLIELSPHKEVRAQAMSSLAAALLESPTGGASDRARAKELLLAVGRDYADTKAAARAERSLFEIEHLQIGMAAPDIEATDQEGKPFKLSDYRGKVVVLDFWGFW